MTNEVHSKRYFYFTFCPYLSAEYGVPEQVLIYTDRMLTRRVKELASFGAEGPLNGLAITKSRTPIFSVGATIDLSLCGLPVLPRGILSSFLPECLRS